MRRQVSLLLSLALLCVGGVSLRGEQQAVARWITTIEAGEDLPVIAAWSPDGRRLAYGTEREVSRREITPKRDTEVYSYPGEVWVTDLKGKPKRILKGKQFSNRKGKIPSFSVTRLAWSPDGQKLAVELSDAEGSATFLFTPKGKNVKLGASRRNFLEGYGAGWLGDNESLGLLREAVNPRLLHRVSLVRVSAGRNLWLFRERTFAAVAWLPRARKAVMVERDREFAEPPRLVLGNLENGTVEVLDELREGYLGGLQVTPDETRVSYFVGQEKLAVRSLAAEAAVEYLPIPLGRYQWVGRSATLLFLEPEEPGRRKGWLTLYNPVQESKLRLLPEVQAYDFWVGPEGGRVAVLIAGDSPELRVYRLEIPSLSAQ